MTNQDANSATAVVREQVRIAQRKKKLAKLRLKEAKRVLKAAKQRVKSLRRKLKELEAEPERSSKSDSHSKAKRKPAAKTASKGPCAALEMKLSQIQTRAALQ